MAVFIGDPVLQISWQCGHALGCRNCGRLHLINMNRTAAFDGRCGLIFLAL